MSVIFYTAVLIEVFQDIWLVGYTFLKEMHDSLFTVEREAIAKELPKPYIFQHFNVKLFDLRAAVEGLARSINPLIEAFNENHRLPQYILVIPDKDILLNIKSCESYRAA